MVEAITLFNLSKIRVLPYSVIFIKEDEKLDEKEYFAIWNPKVFKDQINGLNDGTFENWFKELEFKLKNEKS